jgi:hypothetical protein
MTAVFFDDNNLQVAVTEYLMCLNNERNLLVGSEKRAQHPSSDEALEVSGFVLDGSVLYIVWTK